MFRLEFTKKVWDTSGITMLGFFSSPLVTMTTQE